MIVPNPTSIDQGAYSFVFCCYRVMLTKQKTKHVEWYHGDFSDPEAVSGSSTSLIEKQPFGAVLRFVEIGV